MMSGSLQVLYVSAEGGAMCAPEWSVPGRVAARLEVSCGTAESLCGPEVCRRYAAVIVDGANLGARAVELARRVRWLGFDGTVVLIGFGKTELDRVLAREAGADVVCPGGLSGDMLEMLLGNPPPRQRDTAGLVAGALRARRSAPSRTATV